MALVGRIRQTIQLIFSWGLPIQDERAQAYLSPAQYALYMTMPRSERQHHLRVLCDLLNGGHRHPALLKAALLHDVGKTRYRFALPQKVLVVVVRRLAPKFFYQWGAGPPERWKRPFVVSLQHPQWSADMAAEVGLSPLSLELIRRHQDKPSGPPQTEADHLLRLLQAADDRN